VSDGERSAEIEVEGGRARVRAVGFALAAAMRAAYYRVGRFHVALAIADGAPLITLAPKRPLSDEDLAAAAEELARELPEAELRVQLLDANRADREYLFARALFGAEAADQERMLAEVAQAGAGEDPLGIAIPWEEKYGPAPRKEKAARAAAGPSDRSDGEE
jgi:hypothetical protein